MNNQKLKDIQIVLINKCNLLREDQADLDCNSTEWHELQAEIQRTEDKCEEIRRQIEGNEVL